MAADETPEQRKKALAKVKRGIETLRNANFW